MKLPKRANPGGPFPVCRGRCHCGQVQIRVRLPDRVTVHRCNCSICTKTGYLHLFVERDGLQLIRGKGTLNEYRFNTGLARHYFCRICGVKPFYVPRSHPDGYSVNLNCLEPGELPEVSIEDFDGLNWEENVENLRKHP